MTNKEEPSEEEATQLEGQEDNLEKFQSPFEENQSGEETTQSEAKEDQSEKFQSLFEEGQSGEEATQLEAQEDQLEKFQSPFEENQSGEEATQLEAQEDQLEKFQSPFEENQSGEEATQLEAQEDQLEKFQSPFEENQSGEEATQLEAQEDQLEKFQSPFEENHPGEEATQLEAQEDQFEKFQSQFEENQSGEEATQLEPKEDQSEKFQSPFEEGQSGEEASQLKAQEDQLENFVSTFEDGSAELPSGEDEPTQSEPLADKLEKCQSQIEEESISQVIASEKRVILLVDVDCFEYQVWMRKLRPDLVGKDIPGVVVNPDNIILAVNYSARRLGIKRGKSPKALREAKELCPQLIIIQAGKKERLVDTDYPLEESDKIIDVMREYARGTEVPVIIESSSRDEFYLDVTNLVTTLMRRELKNLVDDFCVKSYAIPGEKDLDELTESRKQYPHHLYNSQRYVTVVESRKSTLGWKPLKYIIQEIYGRDLEDYHYDETRLIFGGIIARTLMKLIEQRTGYHVSVGVGHNKLIAKLACDRNKPQGITIMLDAAIPRLSNELKFQDLPGYKGANGDKLREVYKEDTGKDLVTLQDVHRIGMKELVKLFTKMNFISPEIRAYNLIKKSLLKDDEPVITRYYSDTLSQSMPFIGRHKVTSLEIFKARVDSVSYLFVRRLKYRLRIHSILPSQCSVRTELKEPSRSTNKGLQNSLELDQKKLPSIEEVYKFILEYIKTNEIDYLDITHIYLKATNFEL